MWLVRMLLCVALFAAIWITGLLWYALQMPSEPASDPRGDVIVVLTGGPGRLDYGFRLLSEGRGEALFISGVSKGVTLADALRTASSETQRRLKTGKHLPIYLGNHAVNTIGNADETKQWLEGKPYRSLVLVTSNYHMPRSVSEFREVLPEMQLVPAPVFSGDFTKKGWLVNSESQRLVLSEYHKFIASKLRHWFVSATRPAA